jgi:integrase
VTASARALRPLTRADIAREVAKLPELPEAITYLDDFAGERRVIQAPALRDVWQLRVHGKAATLEFGRFPPGTRLLLKHWAHWLLSKASPATLRSHYWRDRGLLARIVGSDVFTACLALEPMVLRSVWHAEILPRTRVWAHLVGLKSFLHFACEMRLGHLRPEHRDFIGGFRLGSRDKYANVRSGRVFLTMNEESAIVDYFDELNARVRSGQDVDPGNLRNGCVLLLAYQYGFRPLQITKLREQDVKQYDIAAGDGPVIHVTSETVKQRWSAQRYGMVRAIKREWAFMFAAFLAHRRTHPELYPQLLTTVPGSLFGMYAAKVTETIGKLTTSISGVRRSANELRHTAAQRLVDAGATREELAEFMGHTSVDTGLVYFEGSPTQAALINKALAVSPIYSAIVEVARTRTIDKSALMKVGSDHQIGGSPHGIPIAGIGACEFGQSLCVKNPVLACYGCRKFLPVTDVASHRQVLDSLRPIVRQFYDVSRGETQSPAYAQLARTLAAVQEVMKAVGGDAT